MKRKNEVVDAKSETNAKIPKNNEKDKGAEDDKEKSDEKSDEKNQDDQGSEDGEGELYEINPEQLKQWFEKSIENEKVREQLMRLECLVQPPPEERDTIDIDIKEPLIRILCDVSWPMNVVYVDKDDDRENPWNFLKGGEIGLNMFEDETVKRKLAFWMWKGEKNIACMLDIESKDPLNPNIIIMDTETLNVTRELKFSDFLTELQALEVDIGSQSDDENGAKNDDQGGEGEDAGNDDGDEDPGDD